MITAVQISAVWTIGGFLIGWGLLLAGKAIVAIAMADWLQWMDASRRHAGEAVGERSSI